MIFKELIKSEIERVPDNRLEELYSVVRTYSQPSGNGNGPSFMSRLREVTIDGPEDFAENIDLYLTGENSCRN